MDTIKTGGYLAALRKSAGMTQQEVADRLGVSNKTVSKWESGGGFPDIAVLPALAELYDVTADDLLAGETVRHSTGGQQVADYLAQRYGLRWRIGYAAAALCLLAAALWRSSDWTWLLLAGSGAALWIGWGRCGKEALRIRLLMLFPLAAALLFLLLGKCFPASLIQNSLTTESADYFSGVLLASYFVEHAVWDLTLLLLPVLYLLARHTLRRYGDETALLSPAAFRWVLAGWIASLIVEIPRWLVVTPRMVVYLEDPVFGGAALQAGYANAARWFAVLRWGVIAVTLVLAALAERKAATKQQPERSEAA